MAWLNRVPLTVLHSRKEKNFMVRSPLMTALLCLWLTVSLASEDQKDASQRLACLAQSTKAVLDVFFVDQANATTAWDTVRSMLLKFGEDCLGMPNEIQPINLMVPDFPSTSNLNRWNALAEEFEQKTGVEVNLSPIIFYQLPTEMVFSVMNTPGQYDGWIFVPESTGAVAALGGFADLTPFIRDDTNLRFSEYNRFYREVSAVYGQQTIGLPMDGDLLLMYYRADLFTRYNLTVPETWDGLLDMARTMNGTDSDGAGEPDLQGICLDLQAECKGTFMITAVAASYIQYLGTSHGYWFDPDVVPELKPLNNNPGMRAALQFWHDIMPYGNSETGECVRFSSDFQAGRCLISINLGDEFRASTRSNISKLGMLGVAPLPGSTHVLDRTTNTLVACDAKRCPYAHAYTNPRTGEEGWVNTAPYPALGGWTGGVSNFSSIQQQRNTFAFLAYVNSPNTSWEAVLDPDSTIDPFRDEHLNDVERWVQAGYLRPRVTAYLNAIKQSLSNHNVMLDTRLAYDSSTADYRYPLRIAADNATQQPATNDTFTAVMQFMEASYYATTASAVNKLFANNSVVLAQQYWRLIGRTGSVQDLINPTRKQPNTTGETAAAGSSGLSSAVLAAAVTAAAAGLAAILAAAAVLYVRHVRAQQHLSLFGKVLAPGVGPNTTLVITDVQDSTTLFEVLPVACMDEAMQLLCSITRATLVQHKGYESATEGDSFIIAFHTARDAVMFCMDLQAALLSAPWSTELLETEGVPSVHPRWVVATPQAQACAQMLKGVSVPPAGTCRSVRWATPFQQVKQSLYQKWMGRAKAQAPPKPPPSPSKFTAFADWSSHLTHRASDPSVHIKHSTSEEQIFTSEIEVELAPEVNYDRISDDDRYRQPRISTAADSDSTGCSSTIIQLPSTSHHRTSLQNSVLLGLHKLKRHVSGRQPSAAPQPVSSLHELLAHAWQAAHALQPGEATADQDQGIQLVWAGPRVRCGVASGLVNPQDATNIKQDGRAEFNGDFLAAAKLMEGCAHGGQILLSQATFNLLDRAQLPSDVVLLHLGKHLLKPPAVAPVPQGGDEVPAEVKLSVATVDDQDLGRTSHDAADFGLNPMGPEYHDLYTIMHAQQMPRLAALAPVKATSTIVTSALSAPVGVVTIAFLSLVGTTTLKAWDAQETAAALVTFASIAKQQQLQARGFLVEHVDGFMLVAFPCPVAALHWALALQLDMLHAPWSPALLKQALAEELLVQQVDAQGNSRDRVLMRGPRIKVGLANGATKSEVHASTGRIAYRGKVMNRAARIASSAASGQVLCSGNTWAAAVAAAGQPAGALNAAGLKCLRLGETQLKGI